jgi:hypothetical protein
MLATTAKRERSALIRLLLEKGAPVDERNTLGKTVIHFATMRGERFVVRALFDGGADPRTKFCPVPDMPAGSSECSTMAGLAAQYGHPEVAALLEAAPSQRDNKERI